MSDELMLESDAVYLREAAGYYPAGSGTQRRFVAIAERIERVLACRPPVAPVRQCGLCDEDVRFLKEERRMQHSERRP